MQLKRFDSNDTDVWKYVFTDSKIVLESVLYRYGTFNERTVICCSVQSGCPIGCTFCGTGNNFIKNITADQIVYQIKEVLKDQNIEDINSSCAKFQIMFMSMGEPMMNWDEVETAIIILNREYPNAQLLISTIGVKNDRVFNKMIRASKQIDKIGLQFSIHEAKDVDRDELIPYKNKYNLREIRDRGTVWWKETGRKPYLNYVVTSNNDHEMDIDNLKQLFSPSVFAMTFSVLCESDETLIHVANKSIVDIKKFEQSFIDDGYDTRVFDPAGQDDIGGGCGQLWYVQDFLNKEK